MSSKEELGTIIDYSINDWSSSLSDHLLAALAEKPRITPPEYADVLVNCLMSCSGAFVHTKGAFYAYRVEYGIYEAVQEAELRSVIHNLQECNGYHGYRHKLSAPMVKQMLSIAADRLLDKNFFNEAMPGIMAKNGFLQLSDSKIQLQAKHPSQRARVYFPFDYDPSADTTACKTELDQLLQSTDNAQMLVECLGVALFDLGTLFQKVCVLEGPGGNGKSTALKLAAHLFPDHCRSSVPFGDMKDDYQRILLDGSRINLADEFSPLQYDALQRLKDIVCGSPITARRVRETGRSIQPTALHMSCTNSLPALPEVSVAVARRFMVLRLTDIVPLDRQDINYVETFMAQHGQALFCLAIEGVRQVLQRGSIFESDESKQIVQDWIFGADRVHDFLSDMIELTGLDDDCVQSSKLYAAYADYADEREVTPLNAKSFSIRLKGMGHRTIKRSEVYWLGMKLKD
jgi:P4 family phage/plasmid primase-like protien